MKKLLFRRLKCCLLGDRWVTVLMYHSVAPDAARNWGPWEYAVTPEQFKQHINHIAQEYEPTTLDSLINNSSVPENAIVVTFDDGFQDTLTTALPILETYGVPATVHVTTGFLSDHHAPFEYRVAESLQAMDHIDVSVNGLHLERALPTDEALVRAYDKIKQWGMHVGREKRRELLSQLPDTKGGIKMLTEPEIEKLSNHPLITVGAHGHDHLPLTGRKQSTVKTDIEDCREQLESLTETSIDHFSYPYGAFDYEVTSVVKQLGFKTATTTRPYDFVLSSNKELYYEIPRFDASNGLREII